MCIRDRFEKIQMSEERQREQLERQLNDIEMGIDEIKTVSYTHLSVTWTATKKTCLKRWGVPTLPI